MAANVSAERQTGLDVRIANVMAVKTISNILKSSLGPQGLDKMLVDNVGDVVISNDGATILKTLEIKHPAAKVLVDLSQLQDSEVGDGTTTVVLIASALLQNGLNLIKQDIHPTAIISAYRLAMKECVKYIKNHLSYPTVSDNMHQSLISLAKTTLSSKLIGPSSDRFASLVVDAMNMVKTFTVKRLPQYPVSSVNILTTHGLSFKESFIAEGYVLKVGRSSQGMPTSVKNAKIALLDFNLRHQRLHLGISLTVTDPTELEKIRQRERDIAKEKVEKILNSGANVVLTTQGIDDMCLKYFVERKCLAIRRIEKKDINRIAKVTNGTLVHNMANEEGEEIFNPEHLGTCDVVFEERLGDWDHIFFKGCSGKRACTLILRGANEFMLEEAERSVHDALCAVSRALESNAICPGGGTVETALSVHLDEYALNLNSRQQIAVSAFADALLTIPKTLALNAAYDSSTLVAKLRAFHSIAHNDKIDVETLLKNLSTGGNANQVENDLNNYKNLKEGNCNTDKDCNMRKKFSTYGLDLNKGKIQDALAAGVLEPAIGKIKSIKFATEAAITILRIDDNIKNSPDENQYQR